MATISSRFEHDCTCCAFHGRLGKYDVYSHNSTLILRFASDGPEYLASDISIIRHLPDDSPFRIAAQMAK